MLIQQDKCLIPYVSENADTSHSYKTLSLIKHFFEERPVVEHIPKRFNQIQYLLSEKKKSSYFLVFLDMKNKMDQITYL